MSAARTKRPRGERPASESDAKHGRESAGPTRVHPNPSPPQSVRVARVNSPSGVNVGGMRRSGDWPSSSDDYRAIPRTGPSPDDAPFTGRMSSKHFRRTEKSPYGPCAIGRLEEKIGRLSDDSILGDFKPVSDVATPPRPHEQAECHQFH